MTIATPKQPFSRQPNGWAPTDMSHVQPGGWIEVQVGEEYVAGWRNVVFGYVLGFASGEEVFMLVADEVQDPAVTGIPNHAVVRVALADI